MARLARLTLAGHLHHIVHRGNNAQAIFKTVADRTYFLELLRELARSFQVDVHAYVLLADRFQLLATPASHTGIPRLMQALGRRYVRYFNDAYGRSGTLWEGRYRSMLVQESRHLLALMAHLDAVPVRSGVAVSPRDHPWSSHAHYAGLRREPLVTPHSIMWQLGNTPFAREAAYQELVAAELSRDPSKEIADSMLASGWALGDRGYLESLQAQTARRVSRKSAGRPARSG